MPVIAATGKQRRKVRFSNNRPASKTTTNGINLQATSSVSVPAAVPRPQTPTAANPSAKDIMTTTPAVRPGIPDLFIERPAIHDPLTTETSELQEQTVDKCLPFLQGIQKSQRGPFNRHGVPALHRDDHISYLYESLEEYPDDFVALDASRPWMCYWALAGLSLLGEDVSKFRQR